MGSAKRTLLVFLLPFAWYLFNNAYTLQAPKVNRKNIFRIEFKDKSDKRAAAVKNLVFELTPKNAKLDTELVKKNWFYMNVIEVGGKKPDKFVFGGLNGLTYEFNARKTDTSFRKDARVFFIRKLPPPEMFIGSTPSGGKIALKDLLEAEKFSARGKYGKENFDFSIFSTECMFNGQGGTHVFSMVGGIFTVELKEKMKHISSGNKIFCDFKLRGPDSTIRFATVKWIIK
jgi:hypothetical protein